MSERKSHHLWSAERDGDQIQVHRSKLEPEFEEEAIEVCASLWGLWGATLVDNSQFSKAIPTPTVTQFNSTVAKIKQGAESPRVYSWAELRKAFGTEEVSSIRAFVRDGMRTRLASRDLNIPFVMAADVINAFEDMDRSSIKAALKMIKAGEQGKVVTKYGSAGKDLIQIYDEYATTGSYKIAIDESARNYFESYYGPYGKDLVAEIKKRVVADITKTWMVKNGVDEAAADYWSNYFADGYGAELIKDVEKRPTPA